ncbi:cupin domain-containing protein [Bordetella genomosp. 11]|uniref:Cupin n=1 Tax=Bordetella genomosp. 11 TaxID=1416808 RepID=A0A261UEZ2_9BORD|nr:cupin domain-containing protein [Bordetella genomosp. 11]OZI60506.1 cupin [Bordetella genomosp. 11]
MTTSKTLAALLLASGICASAHAQHPPAAGAHAAGAGSAHGQPAAPMAEVKALMTKQLADYPGKEATLLEVDYPPGAVDPVHRHDAHAFVYVLEGTIVMGLRGSEPVTLTAGQTFYEGPNDVHTIGHNASQTKPAKFVVLLLKNSGSPVLTPVE